MTVQDLSHSIKTWRFTRERKIHLAIGFGTILVYEFLARPFYRPWVYSNQINDLHFADTIGNTLGTVATIFVLIGLIGEGKSQHLFMIKTITLSVVLYELAHPLLGKTIDPWDVAATFLTGALSMVLYKSLHRAE